MKKHTILLLSFFSIYFPQIYAQYPLEYSWLSDEQDMTTDWSNTVEQELTQNNITTLEYDDFFNTIFEESYLNNCIVSPVFSNHVSLSENKEKLKDDSLNTISGSNFQAALASLQNSSNKIFVPLRPNSLFEIGMLPALLAERKKNVNLANAIYTMLEICNVVYNNQNNNELEYYKYLHQICQVNLFSLKKMLSYGICTTTQQHGEYISKTYETIEPKLPKKLKFISLQNSVITETKKVLQLINTYNHKMQLPQTSQNLSNKEKLLHAFIKSNASANAFFRSIDDPNLLLQNNLVIAHNSSAAFFYNIQEVIKCSKKINSSEYFMRCDYFCQKGLAKLDKLNNGAINVDCTLFKTLKETEKSLTDAQLFISAHPQLIDEY